MEGIELKNKIIEDLEKEHRGKTDDKILDDTLQKMRASNTAYYASGSIVSIFFYAKVTLDLDGKDRSGHFEGNSYGPCTVGGGKYWGDVYTDDIDKLFEKTDSFTVTSNNVYICVLFHDKDGTLLGHFQGGGFSISGSTCSGNGSWSHCK